MRTFIKLTSTFLVGLSCFFLPLEARATPPLDTTFGNGGHAITPFTFSPPNPPHVHTSAQGVAIQPDGKIVVVGTFEHAPTRMILVRYNTEGSLDTGIGNGGKILTDLGFLSRATAVAVQPDGRIVVVGAVYTPTLPNHEYLAVRFQSNGLLDNSFGTGGIVRIPTGAYAEDLAIQPDGKIVIVGQALLVRLNPNGSLDSSFDGDGKVSAGGSSLVLQQDGKIVVAGRTGNLARLARINADGSPDPTFDGDGIVLTSLGYFGGFYSALAIQPDGKIVAAGAGTDIGDDGNESDFASVVRYHPTGALDDSFDGDGIANVFLWGQFYSLVVRPNGQIVTGGGSTFGGAGSSYLGRFSSDGSLYGVSTYRFGYASWFSALAMQPDGKIVAAGGSYDAQYQTAGDVLVARYLPDVTISGRVTTPTGQGLRNTTVVLTDEHGTIRTVTTSSFGVYGFDGVIDGQNYTLTVRSRRYRFAPRTFQANGSLTGIDLFGQE